MRSLILMFCFALAACSSNSGNNMNGGGADLAGTGDGGTPAAPDMTPTGPQAGCGQPAPMLADSDWMIEFAGVQRIAHVHVPASYVATVPSAVVLDFHGYTSNGSQEEILTSMNEKGDKENFIAVHPEGLDMSWNAGACCGTSATNMVDDVGFVGEIIDQLESKLCIDPQRVFAAGMSNGGFLSHRLGCELSDRIAAIAPVAGVLGVPTCTPTRPVPVIGFHGTADALVPYNGDTALNFPPVLDTYQGWVTRNGCDTTSVETFNNVDSTCQTWSGCSAGADVTLCTVQGGGHAWPGGFPIPGVYTTPNLVATDALWTFFSMHPMPKKN